MTNQTTRLCKGDKYWKSRRSNQIIWSLKLVSRLQYLGFMVRNLSSLLWKFVQLRFWENMIYLLWVQFHFQITITRRMKFVEKIVEIFQNTFVSIQIDDSTIHNQAIFLIYVRFITEYDIMEEMLFIKFGWNY